MAIQSIGLIDPVKQFIDENGAPYAGGTIGFYTVGTLTLLNVYSDPALTSALTNPVPLNAAGRTSTSSTGPVTAVYCQQQPYDYILKDSGGTTIQGPITFSGSQWPGQVQGQATLSPAVNANGYTNRFTTTINKAASGTHALFAGTRFDIPTIGAGGSTLTEAATVYIEGAPATATNPYSFHIASGASKFDGPVTFSSFTGFNLAQVNFRLTLTTGVPVTVNDVTAAGTLYFTPYTGNVITLYNGSSWVIDTSAEMSIAVPASTSQMYDVFCYDVATVPTLELTAWTNDTTRATALTTQDGVLVKSGVTTRRYVGSFRTTGVANQTEDSATKRYVWNYYNRVKRPLVKTEATATWNYTTATVRQANGAATNKVETVVGVQESELDLMLKIPVRVDVTGVAASIVSAGIGEGATTTYAAGSSHNAAADTIDSGTIVCRLSKYPSVGYQYWSWNEWSTAVGTTSWFNSQTAGSVNVSGLEGWIEG